MSEAKGLQREAYSLLGWGGCLLSLHPLCQEELFREQRQTLEALETQEVVWRLGWGVWVVRLLGL